MSKIIETSVLNAELKKCVDQYIEASMDFHALRRKIAEDAHNNPESFKANSHSFMGDMFYLKIAYILNGFIAPKHVKCIEKSLKGFMKDKKDPITIEQLQAEAQKLVETWIDENTAEAPCEEHACGDLRIESTD